MVKKINDKFYVKIDSNRDVYGATGFECQIVNDETNVSYNNNQLFEELILPHENHSANSDGINTVGSKVIIVKNNSFVQGDVISANNEMYYIKEVIGNELYLFVKLRTEISDNEQLSQVGNTGIYRVPITITSLGYYTIIILNNNLNVMNRELGIKIIPEDITDAHLKLDEISGKVDTLSSERNYVAFV